MSDDRTYTLEQLAAEFGLTTRTARHYLEHLLPPQHRPGRGKRARFGRDTRNCFAFIRKAREAKLASAQIARLLRGFSQAQIDRVASGLEQLTIVPQSAAEPIELASSPCMAGDFPDLTCGPASAVPGPAPRWRVLYADDQLQITHHGQASAEQREQVRLAVALIKRILRA